MAQLPNTQTVNLGLVGSSKFGISSKINAEKTYNMYISDGWLACFPGYKKVLDLKSSNDDISTGRGFFRSIRGKLIIVVIGSSVYRLDENIGETFIGNINSTSGRVYIDENLSNQIAIVDGINLWIYNRVNNALTKQTVPADLVPNYVSFHDTYFLIGNGNLTGNGSKWFAYKYLNDNQVEIAYELAMQSKPDYALAVLRLPGKSNNVMVFGSAVSEIQNNVGGLEGYRRVSTLNVDYGALSIDTIAATDKFVFWLSSNEFNSPVIMAFDGQSATPISTDGINLFLNSLSNPEKSNGYFYKTDIGHLVYVLTFYDSADNTTLMYDVNNGSFFHLSDQHVNYHPARQIIHINNKSYFISLNNASIYEISSKYKTIDENIVQPWSSSYKTYKDYVIPRTRVCPPFRKQDNGSFRMSKVYLTMEQGNDPYYDELSNLEQTLNYIISQDDIDMITQDGQPIVANGANGTVEDGQLLKRTSLAYEPAVDFCFSNDGAVTYGHTVRQTLNYSAHRVNSIDWIRLGTSNDFTAKFKFWGKSDFIIGDAFLEVTP